MDETHQESSMDSQEISSSRKRARGVSPDTKQRRERGRAAQAAFRKRQIDTIQQQQEQLAAFSDAFKMINLAYSKFKLAVKMSEAMGSGDVPPHIANEILDQLEQALGQAPNAASLKANSSTKILTTTTTTPSALTEPDQGAPATSSTQFATLDTQIQPEHSAVLSDYALLGEADKRATTLIPAAGSHKQWDPLLGTDPIPQSMAVRMPPIELIPYMSYAQHTSRTFAGRLFWSTMSFGYRLLTDMDWNAPGIAKMFQYYKHHFNQDMVKRRLATKLVTNGTGIIHEDAMPEMTSYVNGLVVKTMAESGEQIQNYLDPREVELYFRRRWIDPNNLNVADSSDAYSTLSTDELTKALVKELTIMAVCFGDTPRYHVDDVEKVYQTVAGRVQPLPSEMSFSTSALGYVPAY